MLRGTLRSRIFLASLLGRLPVGAIALLLILRTREITGSYAAGGAVAGVNALAHGLAAPVVGRLMDRRGQSAILAVAGALSAVAMGGFAFLPDGAALAWPLALAALAGATQPPLGAALRTIWTREIDPAHRHAVFTFESTVFELIYILGPILFISAIGAWSLPAALVATGVVTLAGTVAFAAAPAARAWRPEAAGDRRLLGALASARFRGLLAVFLLFGVVIAAIEMGVVAFVEERDARGALGPVLGVWGLGSMLGGVVAARSAAPADPARRMALLFGGMGLGALPLVLASGTVELGALILVSGVFIAPALSIAFALVGQVAPAGTVNEAYTWAGTGVATGAAGGSAAAGWLVETAGPPEAFVMAAVAAGLAALPAMARLAGD